jgi:hypothetical protein
LHLPSRRLEEHTGMMRSAMVMVLFAFVGQEHTASALADDEALANELVDRSFSDRALKVFPFSRADLENTMLEKGSGNLAISTKGSSPVAFRPQVPTSLRRVPPSPRSGMATQPAFHGGNGAGPPVPKLVGGSFKTMAQSAVKERLQVQEGITPAPAAPDALISEASLMSMEREELLTGRAVKALRRFSDALEALPSAEWESRLKPAFGEMALNLETFNPVFTACMMQVQMTAGQSDYEQRDQCLQRLMQPLAGEYGLHAEEPLGKTHRALFREWYESVTGGEAEGQSLQALLKDSNTGAPKAEWLFQRMISDVESAGERGRSQEGDEHTGAASQMEKAVYALGYNLAVEYLANPEKTWLLESFRKFDERVLVPLGRQAEYEFLVVHAIGEKEHAHLGHEAVTLFCPASLEGILRRAMRDHDRDLADYYHHLADLLEGQGSEQGQERVPAGSGISEALISEAALVSVEREELRNGRAVAALRRFSDALEVLPSSGWESRLKPAFAEMALNLETFNPVFTACLMQVQLTAGQSDYERRDQCLQRLVQPLAGEYGLHANEPLGQTHRALFREWYESVVGGAAEGQSLEALLKDSQCGAPKAEWLFERMIADVETGGRGDHGDAAGQMEKAAYALGYNLAVEYLADPEKTWLLESFRKFDARVLVPLGRQAEYEFLVVHAIGEKEHANLGHEAVTLFCPASFEGTIRQAMRDHDRDLADYYHHLADILEGRHSA